MQYLIVQQHGCRSHKRHRIRQFVSSDEEKQQDDIKDTGVLGRSQVRTANGADISKSVNSAVELAKNNPALLNCSDKMFDEMYNQFLKQGMTEKDAYINACLAEGEFVETAQNR